MRAVFLSTGCFDKGGISRYCRYQIEALRSVLGAKNVKVLSLLGPDGTGFETHFEVDWHGTGGFWDKLRFAQAAARLVLTTQADVVHVAHVNMAPLALHIARLSGARTILNVYGLEVWSSLSRRRREAMRAVSHIVADCHFTADYVAVERMHPEAPSVIWDCVDLARFSPGICPAAVREKYGLPNKRDGFVILSLGRLDIRACHKGFDRLVEVFATVYRQAPHARLVIAGGGNDRQRLETLVDKHDIRTAVVFTGPIEEKHLIDCYRAATVFSLVSDRGPRRGEGLPLAALEAMACGVPVIVGNQDGSREAVVGGANGLVVGPFDFTAHSEALLGLIRSRELLERLQRGGREVAERHFGYDRFVEQHRALYSSLNAGQAR